MRRDPTAGARLRSVILDVVDHPKAREHLGWLSAITDDPELAEITAVTRRARQKQGCDFRICQIFHVLASILDPF